MKIIGNNFYLTGTKKSRPQQSSPDSSGYGEKKGKEVLQSFAIIADSGTSQHDEAQTLRS